MDMLNDDSLNSIFIQVARLHHSRAHTLLSKLNIYRGQPPILKLLWDKDGRTHSEIAEEMHLKPATITVMLQRMEKAGLLERRADSEDLRVSRVFLTDKGREIQISLENIFRQQEEECFAGFTIEERLLLRRLLMQMRDNLLEVTEDNLDR